MNQDDVLSYTMEFLNSLDLPGLPPPNLKPVIGSLRNQLGVSLFRAWTFKGRVFARQKTVIFVYLQNKIKSIVYQKALN
ncbi:hypothetical protein GWI33_021463 [Rhynchophorus ferrugineus]|uniref:Uncharacterized protein n=1 Tax=Rhynchophorus ferrugineus TaxID=354439 RepID=A0A834IPD2_RHYFE|nr:hypothetical protein GWI33_021463 [Rhynchophorus ferrugineus]